uniref:Uncharacterized protein n=1 Tax=Meloidogyne enterolobii TaxID=390850 RepID=A0A6V7YCH9_MELEN|nr:unnamed protein product [Meloidogyne enterolobii]
MKEQASEQEFAPLSKQNCLPLSEPSTSQTLEVLQSSNSSLPINNRNSLYHSLPLYWPKGWRTYGPSTQTNSFRQSSLNPEPSFTASTSPLIDNEQETNTPRKIFSLNRHQKISKNDTTLKGWRRKRRKEFNFFSFLPCLNVKGVKLFQFLALLISALFLLSIIIFVIANFSSIFSKKWKQR